MSDDLKGEDSVAEILPKRTQISLFAIFVFSFGLSVYLVILLFMLYLEVVYGSMAFVSSDELLFWPVKIPILGFVIIIMPLFFATYIHRMYGKNLSENDMSIMVYKSFLIGVTYLLIWAPLCVLAGVLTGNTFWGGMGMKIFVGFIKIPIVFTAISLFTFLIYWNLARVFMSFNNKQ